MTIQGVENKKIARYVDLLFDQEALVAASASIIRRRRSPSARLIAKGNVQAIVSAARSRVFSALSPENRRVFCREMCALKEQLKGLSRSNVNRELVSWFTSSVVGLFYAIPGITIAFLWIIRADLYPLICPCGIDGTCKSGNPICAPAI